MTRWANSSYGSPPLFTTPTPKFLPIANGTYVNATHWTYTFLCSACIQTDGSTFVATDAAPSFGHALNPAAPESKGSPGSKVAKHTAQGQVKVELKGARSESFKVWKTWAANGTVG